jgi:predicted AAA+ superfamily ATPase
VATEAKRLENTVAVCLKKHVDFLEDTGGRDTTLCYLRTKEKKEIDFILAENDTLRTLIEVKTSDSTPAPILSYFHKRLDAVEALQLVQYLRQPQSAEGVHVVEAAEWLSGLSA